MSGKFDLGDYRTVAERMADFFAQHPEGSLRPLDPDRPFSFEEHGGATFLVYVAVALRAPDDPTPGVGSAWEPFPGKTTYTRDSELQNAETSAWGRAILATGASDTKNGVASRDEVEARRGEPIPVGIPSDVQRVIRRSCDARGITSGDLDGLVRTVTDNRSEDLHDVRPGDEYEELKSLIKAWGTDDGGES